MRIPIIAGDKISSERKTDYRDALPVNMFAVPRQILGAPGYMLCYSGLTSLGTGSGVDRGAQYNTRQSNQFRVSGTKLISVAADGTVAELGTISGAGQAAMTYSFNNQVIVADGKAFLYNPTDGFQEITDPDLGDPIDCVWVDGYIMFTDGENIYHSDITDETSIDPLKFDTSEFSPDPTLGLSLNDDNKVMVWNRYTLEYFQNVAKANFAFSRLPTRAQKIGIVATHAKCESGGKWYITGGRVDDSVSVHSVTLGRSEKISSREVDKVLKQYTEPQLSDMRMEARTEDNVTFILVHLPNETLYFNETAAKQFGIERAWSLLRTGVGGATYRGINGVFDARTARWTYGDKLNTNIGTLDDSVFTQYGALQEWELYTPLIDLETFSIDEIDLETIPGQNALADASVFVSLTYDGVHYGMEWIQLYSEPLNTRQRFIIRRLGYVSDWVGFKFRGATTARMAFANMELKYG